MCGNSYYKGPVVCRTNLMKADIAEEYVFNKLEEVTNNKALLALLVQRANDKGVSLMEPLEKKLVYVREQIKTVNNNVNDYFKVLEEYNFENQKIVEKLNDLYEDLNKLKAHESELLMELKLPVVKEVSFKQIYYILSSYSKLIARTEPEKQKDLLHSMINRITVNKGNSPTERSIKEVELFFDAYLKNVEVLLTYDTIHRD